MYYIENMDKSLRKLYFLTTWRPYIPSFSISAGIADETLKLKPSYSTIRRYLEAQGHYRKRRPKRDTPGRQTGRATTGEGGFAMITGDSGTGKSVVLRLLAERLSNYPIMGYLSRPPIHMYFISM